MLEAVSRGCGDDAVKEALRPLALVFPPGERAESPLFWQVYFKALRDLPLEALLKAAEEYPMVRGAEHFPKPAEIRALAERHAIPLRKAAYRARRAADSLPRGPRPRAERDAVERMVAEVKDTLSSKKER